jgi:hypothetical protein
MIIKKQTTTMNVKLNRKSNGVLMFCNNEFDNQNKHMLKLKLGEGEEYIPFNNYELGALYHTIEYYVNNRQEYKFALVMDQLKTLSTELYNIQNTINENGNNLSQKMTFINLYIRIFYK